MQTQMVAQATGIALWPITDRDLREVDAALAAREQRIKRLALRTGPSADRATRRGKLHEMWRVTRSRRHEIREQLTGGAA